MSFPYPTAPCQSQALKCSCFRYVLDLALQSVQLQSITYMYVTQQGQISSDQRLDQMQC